MRRARRARAGTAGTSCSTPVPKFRSTRLRPATLVRDIANRFASGRFLCVVARGAGIGPGSVRETPSHSLTFGAAERRVGFRVRRSLYGRKAMS